MPKKQYIGNVVGLMERALKYWLLKRPSTRSRFNRHINLSRSKTRACFLLQVMRNWCQNFYVCDLRKRPKIKWETHKIMGVPLHTYIKNSILVMLWALLDGPWNIDYLNVPVLAQDLIDISIYQGAKLLLDGSNFFMRSLYTTPNQLNIWI